MLEAFKTLKKLEYGDDLAPLSAIDAEIAKSKENPAVGKALEKALLDVLTGDGTQNGKDYACRKLKVVGGEASVSILGKLLHDKKLSHMARYALESMPVAAAGKALLDALPQLSGVLKAGVIGSLGVRQENGAVSALAALMNDSDATIARAAAGALGAIRSKDAAKALRNAKPNPEAISVAIDSALACAENLLADGDKKTALLIYRELSKGGQPKHVALAAKRGTLACLGKG